MKLYCLSGLGVDERAFGNLKVQDVELVHIPWIKPFKNESLSNYSKRLYEIVQPEEDYYLIGVSFGGMVAAEFARIQPPKKLFLVSTIGSRKELPWYLRIGASLRLHFLIPSNFMRSANFITYFLFGTVDKNDKALLREILKDTDPVFLKWAVHAITQWNGSGVKGINIHGTRDRILPLPPTAHYKIKKGGHFMIYNQGKEISAVISRELSFDRPQQDYVL